jgi:[calcium/calmodulin-dependent protein kinase] kinase
MYSTESLLLPPINPPTNQCPENTNHGLTSTPATISSSSADDFSSGMSQSASHPSIPSVISNASSLSGDGYSCKDKDMEEVPSILRTGETVKPSRPNSPPRPAEEDESRYYRDDEDEDESEEEVLMIGKRKPSPKAADPQPSN